LSGAIWRMCEETMPFILIFVSLLVGWVLFAARTLIPPALIKWGRSLTDN